MPTYYYQFDLTASVADVNSSMTISDSEGYDVSEFNNDSRGTPRVADWGDLPNSESQYDIFTNVLNLSDNSSGFISWNDRTSTYQNGSKYYWVQSGNSRFFYFMVNQSQGAVHATRSFSTSPVKKLTVASWYNDRKVLVYFPNYEANGGHSALIINNSISVTWSSSNSRFQSSDSSTTLSHNGTTWVINNNGTSSTASLNSSNVGSYVDPASSDIVWQNNSSVTTPSAGAQGDPHINPILGNPYTI